VVIVVEVAWRWPLESVRMVKFPLNVPVPSRSSPLQGLSSPEIPIAERKFSCSGVVPAAEASASAATQGRQTSCFAAFSYGHVCPPCWVACGDAGRSTSGSA
jgi:hypothetical protein